MGIFAVVSTVYETFESKQYFTGKFSYLSKAFDCLPSDILIEKLKRNIFETVSKALIEN